MFLFLDSISFPIVEGNFEVLTEDLCEGSTLLSDTSLLVFSVTELYNFVQSLMRFAIRS